VVIGKIADAHGPYPVGAVYTCHIMQTRMVDRIYAVYRD